MTLTVCFSAIVFFILGYYLIDNIDKFIENKIDAPYENISYKKINDKGPEQNIILIYGKNELTKRVENYCESKKYIYESMKEINPINTDYRYICLFALSDNDTDNLTISSIAAKIYSIPNITALCNSQGNLKMYKEFSINNVLLYDGGIDKVFSIIKGLVEDAIKTEN